MLLGDFHTHSRFSDGKGTLEQNCDAALERGLKQLGCTEHGLKHVAFGMKERDIPVMRRTVDRLNAEKGGKIEVLLGVEANITTSYGDVDLLPKHYPYFDFVAAGFHKTSFSPLFFDYFRYTAMGIFKKHFSAAQIRRFTRTFVAVIRSGKVDFITHLFYGVPVNTKEVAAAAADYGVFLELNGKKVSIPDSEIEIMVDNPHVKFIVNSDAHSPKRVGEVSVPMGVVERLHIDKNRIVNWENIIKFSKRK